MDLGYAVRSQVDGRTVYVGTWLTHFSTYLHFLAYVRPSVLMVIHISCSHLFSNLL